MFAGTSGWAYPTWRPGFYPEKLTAAKFLAFYAAQVNSVEVNFTFRKLATEAQLQGWLAQTGDGFRFSFKAPQRITHFSRLRECDAHVDEFVRSLEVVKRAGKLGMLLFQLPPNFKVDHARLQTFLAASALRKRGAPAIAFEFRHESWFCDDTYGLLKKHKAALCIAETDELQSPEVHTAKAHTCFRLRRHGGYSAEELAGFAERLTRLAGTREVYAYFKHEDEPTGALNAREFLRLAAAGRG